MAENQPLYIIIYDKTVPCRNICVKYEKAKELGIDVNNDRAIYIDKVSGKNMERPRLQEMLSFIRSGDTVYVSDISRLGRNTQDLLYLVDKIENTGASLISLKENFDTSTPTGKFVLTMFAAVSELERASILERQREGIAIAKAMGKYKGRKPKDIDKEAFTAACKEWRADRRTAVSIQREFGLSSQTFYRRIKNWDL